MSGEKSDIKKKKKSKAGRRAIMFLLMLLAGVIIYVLVVTLTGKDRGGLKDYLPWNNNERVYVPVTQDAPETEKSFSAELCVGPDNCSLEGVSLQGNAKGALFSLDDKKILYSKNMYEKVYPASITKIITALCAIKYGRMDQTVEITWEDLELESGSQVAGLKIGDKVKLGDLLRALLVHSGNDAAQAIARSVGGDMNSFVKMMNDELQAIGCTGSHFTNPTGLHSADHYTTVYDIYLMLNAAIAYDDFLNIIQIPVYDLRVTDKDGSERHITLDSTDHYLTGSAEPPKGVTVLGGKTGTTSAAGNCLALLSQNLYGQPYISVIVGESSKDALYRDMNTFLEQINTH